VTPLVIDLNDAEPQLGSLRSRRATAFEITTIPAATESRK
jgi:hypothetical protein